LRNDSTIEKPNANSVLPQTYSLRTLKLIAAVAGYIINTDDNMRLETVAPREAFRPTMEENAGWIESQPKP
jgi:hypothetical protein